MSRNSTRYANATKKCGPLNKEGTAPATGAGERETRRWLYARRSVTQARWATAPLPGGATLRTGWPRDTQFRLASLRRKPEMVAVFAHTGGKICAYSSRSRPRDCASCPFVACLVGNSVLVSHSLDNPLRVSQFCDISSVARIIS